MDIAKHRKKIIFASIGLCVILFIVYGFHSKPEIVKSCSAVVERYVLAHYSETYMTACSSVDGNGNATTTPCSETRSWTKPASKVNRSVSDNAPATYPEMPERYENMRRDSDFDYFREYTDTTLTVWTDKGFFEDSISKNNLCINRINSMIDVKYWYGFAMSTDFLIED